jgi:hypothetical protein
MRLCWAASGDNGVLTPNAGRATILGIAMASMPVRLIALLLGLWIGVAPALLFAPAAGATMQITATQNAMPGDCDCCPEPKPSRALCALMCLHGPSLAALQCELVFDAGLGVGPWPARDRIKMGRAAPPDPPPPKPSALT